MQTLADIVNTLITHATWPLLIGLIVLIYHSTLSRILDELPEFIRRSYYRFGGEDYSPARKDAKSIGGDEKEFGREGREGGEDNVENGDKLSKPNSVPTHSSYCEHQLLERLQAEYGVPVYERRSIGVSNYYFDAVMEYKGRLYGIEVRGISGHNNWERIFNDVQKVYDGFIPLLKKRFVFMLCVRCGNGKDDDGPVLREMTKRYDFPTVIRYY